MAVTTVDLVLILLVVIGIAVMVAIGVFAYRRKKKAYKLFINADWRNAQNPKRRYYCIVDRPGKALRLYRGLLSFKPTKNIPLLDVNAYANSDKEVFCYQSPTGSPHDDMICPMGPSISGQGAAMDYAGKVSEWVTTNTNDIFREYQVKHPDFKYDKKELSDKINSIFNKVNVMQTLGVRNVENANIVTLPQKMAVASLSSRANEFITERSGWLEKHSGLIVGLMIMMFVVVGFVILMYGASNYLNNLSSLTHSAVNTYTNLLGIGNHTGSIIPSVGVTVPKVTT